jgi:modification methylase
MMFSDEVFSFEHKREQPRIPFGALLEHGLIQPGQKLYFGPRGSTAAIVLANGQIKLNGFTGSIHAVGRQIQNAPCNGWEHWYYIDAQTGARLPIDTLRAVIREAGRPGTKKKARAAKPARKRVAAPKRRKPAARHKTRRRA